MRCPRCHHELSWAGGDDWECENCIARAARNLPDVAPYAQRRQTAAQISWKRHLLSKDPE